MVKMTKEEIHAEAKDRFKQVIDFEGSERDLMEDDKKFGIGEDNNQWDGNDVKARQTSGRSFLTIMRSNQFTDHIKNQQRQNKPSIKISPTDEGAQEEVATLRQGLIRHIQYESKAQQARQAGFDDAVDEGRGHWIVKTEFVEGTFNRKVMIEPIQDSRSVYMDWRRQRPDYSDCEYGFVITPMSRKVFEDEYPDASIQEWAGSKDDHWYTADDVVIAEYYTKQYKTRNLIKVDIDGETRILFEDELKVDVKTLNVIEEREVEDPVWMWYKMTGAEIIDEEVLPWKEIPIITVIGKENVVDGDWSCKGLIRDIKAPLRLYNFVSSNEADIIAKAPRAPWVGAEGQFEGYEDLYANSNTSDVPFLEYKPVTLGGQMAPPPQRAQFSVDLSNLYNIKANIIDDIKAITGIYDASIGNRSNETSGVAIRAREAQGDAANYHYIDNYAMAINHEGRVINSALNVIYDTARTVTIMGEDDEEKLQSINADDGEGLGTGNFNVTVSVGPSFNSQRQEEAAGLLEMANNSPIVQEVGIGKVIRAQDWPGKDGLANLVDKFIDKKYPGLLASAEDHKDNEQMELLQQQFEQVQKALQETQQQLQQVGEALEKSNADKNAAAAGKIEVDKAGLQLEAKKLQLEEKKLQGEMQFKKAELALKGQEIKADTFKADLDAETKLKTNRNDNEVKLIINEVNKPLEPKEEVEEEVVEEVTE